MRLLSGWWLLSCPPARPPPLARLDAELHGRPLSPALPGASDGAVLLRYIYDGSALAQGRLCELVPSSFDQVTGLELLGALQADGVDLGRFYATAVMQLSSTVPNQTQHHRCPSPLYHSRAALAVRIGGLDRRLVPHPARRHRSVGAR